MQNRMRSKMVRLGLSLAPVFLWAASTQAAPRSVYFWNSSAGTEGTRAAVDLARPGVWGNGEFADSRDVKYEGANTLKITTRNFREGVRFDLKTPFDITEYKETGYLRFRLKFRDAVVNTKNAKPVAAKASRGGFGGDAPEIVGNAQMGALPPLGDIGALPPELGGGKNSPRPAFRGQETPITQLLCTLILDDGIMEGTIDIPKSWENPRQVDFDKARPDARGWLLLSLKLKDMHSTPGASGLVQRMIISADKQDSFYLTQAALVIETGEITVGIRKMSDAPGTQTAEITVPPGVITLVADVEAGAADPSIEWNFDADNVGNLPRPTVDGASPRKGGTRPAKPAAEGEEEPVVFVGPRIDARGLIAKFTYPNEEQNYRVEVTVRDRAGKKEPVTSSVLVRVRG